jgi:hypothetical protein
MMGELERLYEDYMLDYGNDSISALVNLFSIKD